MPTTKIRRVRIRGFQQFRDLDLDFTHPDTGEPVDRICFIGRNGTGKSTLLRLLDGYTLTFAEATVYVHGESELYEDFGLHVVRT
jgi:ATPase subunit of ABC transporter with duplicated ATPase domains